MSARGAAPFMAQVRAKLDEPRKKRQLKGLPDSVFNRVLDEVEESIQSRDYSLFLPRHFVGLYAVLHHRVYGVPVAELVPKSRTMAAARAAQLLAREFGGDRALMAKWMFWAFERERGRHAWRQREGRPITRLGWGFVFGGALVTDWRVEAGGK